MVDSPSPEGMEEGYVTDIFMWAGGIPYSAEDTERNRHRVPRSTHPQYQYGNNLMAPELIYPLYAATYQLYRLSPLYNFSPSALSRHANSLHNLLRGEVLRGVQVGDSNADDNLSRIGSLQSVTWGNLLPEVAWDAEQDRQRRIESGELDLDSATPSIESPQIPALPSPTPSIQHDEDMNNIAEIVYEKARYTAILLKKHGENEGEGDEDELGAGFSSFPLLLTKMPGPLRETFLDFLSSTFDTRPSPLKLPPKFLTKSLEAYLGDLTFIGENGDGTADTTAAQRILRDLIKDLTITRTFALTGEAAGTLKSLDITIEREDLYPLLVRGQKMVELEKRGKKDEDNPFSRALAHHIDGQLALNLDHKLVGMSKIACGAFSLGAEGKIKIAKPVKVRDGVDEFGAYHEFANHTLLDGLIDYAKARRLS